MSAFVKDIAIEWLDRRDDARAVDADKVRAIASSIGDVGLINPVRLRRKADGRFEIVAGVHRVEACRSLGLVEIEAIVVDSGDLFAELAMIDENLCRAELGPADRAQQTARRKAIYLELHPETAAGVAQASGMNAAQRGGQVGHDVDRFDVETARLTGQSERAVRRDAERGEKVCDEALELLRGTSLDTGIYLDGLKRLSPDDQVAAVERDLERAREIADDKARARVEAKKAARDQREADLGARQVALPQKRYGVILADPEWRFETWGENGMDRSADNHYPTSPLEAIKARDVASIAADDSVLFLWATAPMLPQALEVMAAWGFAYKSHAIWRKADRQTGVHTWSGKGGGLVLGTGYWFRNAHELLLVGTRGKVPAPAPGTQLPSMFDAPPLRHSQKPECAHEMIERYFASLPKIELNARARRDGWDAWGLEVPPEAPSDEASEPEPASGVGEGADGAGMTAPLTAPSARMTREAVEPILIARYQNEPTEVLAAETGVPVATLRTWAFRLGLTSRARIADMARERNRSHSTEARP